MEATSSDSISVEESSTTFETKTDINSLTKENVEPELSSSKTGPEATISTDRESLVLPVFSESTVQRVNPTPDDNKSRVILKRKSDSLALLASYVVDSDSEEEEEVTRTAFTELQKPTELINIGTDDSDSDTGSFFNLDSDDASDESSQSSNEEGVIVVKEESEKKEKKSKGAKACLPIISCLDLGDLPPIKDLHISVKEEDCLPFGKVHSIVETLVVIEALPDVPALNLESVLFTKDGAPLGEVFDVFGPVKRPYYTIRFKTRTDIDSKSLSVGTVVFCAPKTKYTQYVFIHQLARMKGSDASWKNDAEVPVELLDYSDDEAERQAKKNLKEAKIKIRAQKIIDVDAPPIKIPSFEERMNQRNTMRNQMFIKNPDKRGPDWYKVPIRPRSDAPGTSSTNIMRAAQFTPPSHYQQQASSPRNPLFLPQNICQVSSTSISFPMNNPIMNMFNMQQTPRMFRSLPNKNNLNGGLHFNDRPPSAQPSFSQMAPNFQGNNNQMFTPPPASTFNQQNAALSLQSPPRLSLQAQTDASKHFLQFMNSSNNQSFAPPNRGLTFQAQANTSSPFRNSSPLYNRACPPMANSPLQAACRSPANRPFQSINHNHGNGSSSFGHRPYPANSPPFCPNFPPSMRPPQANQPNNYFPVPFSTNSSFSQSFRPFQPK